MPLYEYVCEQDGEVIELIRPMDRADEPVEDPAGRGRAFRRRVSAISVASGSPVPNARGCPCGNLDGPCSTGR